MLISLVIAFLLGFGILALHLFDARDQLRRGMVFIQAQALAADLTADSDFGQLPLNHAGGEFSYTLYDAEGQMQWYSSNLERPRRLKNDTLEQEINRFRWAFRGGKTISVPVSLADGSTLMTAKEDQLENKLISDFLQARFKYGFIVLILLCLVALTLVMFLLHWTLRPIKQATQLAAEIGPHNPNQRIPLDKLPQEVMPLVRAVNDGLDRLSQAYEYEQRLVVDAAHQLRTPLAVLSLRLEKARNEQHVAWEAIESDISQAFKLVNQLLLLAYAERSQVASNHIQLRSRSYLPRVVREAMADLLPLFEAQQRTMMVDVDVPAWVRGESTQLREVIRNVLENSLVHGKGTVKVYLSKIEENMIVVDISDEGEGVPLEEQYKMFQRFYKQQPNSAGSGLGLAIVKRMLINAGGNAQFISQHPCIIRLSFMADA
ncbi:sensor histidine kinase [Oligella sp. MSHR50489EDL]|uniref:sensor histidine kinase n=1 Tax=Oligella sp. MSHR50489EDL TaxID=3139409 RepID=UPI003D8129EA